MNIARRQGRPSGKGFLRPIVRDDGELKQLEDYIRQNPAQWVNDPLNK
jgi:hypothetical protein